MITLTNLKKSYNNGKMRQEILKGINLTIQQGEMLAIKGRSGTGKSTLLHILAGLEQATSGNYYFDNKDITQLNYKETAVWRKNKIGFILQNHALMKRKIYLIILPYHYCMLKNQKSRNRS